MEARRRDKSVVNKKTKEKEWRKGKMKKRV